MRPAAAGVPSDRLPYFDAEQEEDEEAPHDGQRLPDDVEGLLAEIAACDDPQRMRRLAAAAANDLTPQDLRRLYLGVEALPDTLRVQAFRQRAPLYTRFLRREGPDFTALRLSSHARLFEAAGRKRAEKSLLVLFTNIAGGAFMSVARLLVRLPPGGFDVLRLDVGPSGDYPGGVPGLGDSLFAVCQAVGPLASGYAGGAALGTSLGGFSALRAALLADLPVGVSISGRFTRLARLERARSRTEAPRIPAFDPLCPCLRPRATTLIAYHAEENEQDAQQARQLAAMLPEAWIRPVAGTDGHNPVPQMMARGELDALLRELWRLSLRRPRGAGGRVTGGRAEVPDARPRGGAGAGGGG